MLWKKYWCCNRKYCIFRPIPVSNFKPNIRTIIGEVKLSVARILHAFYSEATMWASLAQLARGTRKQHKVQDEILVSFALTRLLRGQFMNHRGTILFSRQDSKRFLKSNSSSLDDPFYRYFWSIQGRHILRPTSGWFVRYRQMILSSFNYCVGPCGRSPGLLGTLHFTDAQMNWIETGFEILFEPTRW